MARRNAYYDGITPRSLARPTNRGVNAPIYSMYRPESEAALTQAVAGRQQRFDAASQGLAQELARMGDIETYDRDELEGRMGEFTGRVNKLVQDKYGGDYSAAANELATMVGQERGDPFYAFNKQKVEAVKNYQQDRRRLGANFLSVGDPTDVGLSDWKEGATFEYTPVNKQDITAASINMFKSMANAIRKEGAWTSTTGSKLLERMDQRGFGTPEEVEAFLETKEGQIMIEELKSSMPELAGIKDQQAVEDAIKQGAYSAIGRTEHKALKDPGYDATPSAPEGQRLSPRRIIEADIADMQSNYFAPLANMMAVKMGYEGMEDLQKQADVAGLERVGKMGQTGVSARSGAIHPRQNFAKTQAELDLAEIQDSFSLEVENQGLVMEDINKIGIAGSKAITAINKISDQIDDAYDESVTEWEGIDNKSEKNLKKITEDGRTIKGMNLHPMLGLTILVEGNTKDGKSLEAIVRTPNQLLVKDFAGYYQQLDESKKVDYFNYLEYMRQNNPEEYVKLARVFVKPE